MARIERDNVTVPVVIRSVGGDLRVKGRSGAILIVDGEGLNVEQIGEGHPYVVTCAGDCRIWVPDNVAVSVQSVGGDAKLTDLNGGLDILSVGGDLILRGARDAQIKSVGGDLRVKWAEGNVTVENVGADATIREIEGTVWVANIGSDLYLRNVEGSCKVEQVGSDLVLNIEFGEQHEYNFVAGGDILCRVRPDTSARFIVPLDTRIELDVAAEISETDEEQIITLGDGAATVYLEVGEHSDLRLVGEEEDYMLNLGVQIEEELESRLSTLEARISAQLEGLDERIQTNAQEWIRNAETMAEKAQRQAERAVEHVRQRMESRKPKLKRDIKMSWGMPRPAAAPRPPKAPKPVEPVSEQERLMILQMVQDGKISIEEAERLLAALDA